MKNKLSISFIILSTIIGLYFLNIAKQKDYQSTSSSLIDFSKEDINKIIIQTGQEAIEIIRIDSVWNISGYDSLIINEQSLNTLFNSVFNLKIQNLMTQKQDKWMKFNVDDSTGTHLALIDINDNTIGYYVFGRSNSDYSRCYVRTSNNNVYLANENIMHSLQTRPDFWGGPIVVEDGIESFQTIE